MTKIPYGDRCIVSLSLSSISERIKFYLTKAHSYFLIKKMVDPDLKTLKATIRWQFRPLSKMNPVQFDDCIIERKLNSHSKRFHKDPSGDFRLIKFYISYSNFPLIHFYKSVLYGVTGMWYVLDEICLINNHQSLNINLISWFKGNIQFRLH